MLRSYVIRRLTATKIINEAAATHPRRNFSTKNRLEPNLLLKKKWCQTIHNIDESCCRMRMLTTFPHNMIHHKYPLLSHGSIGVSNEVEKYILLLRELKEQDTVWTKSVADSNKELVEWAFNRIQDVYDGDFYFISSWMEEYIDQRKRQTLILLRSILFLRFRITVRKVMEPLLSEKVPQLDEDKFKGANLVANKENIDRDVDYTFFLKQLEKDMRRGQLDFFSFNNILFPLEEFFEICEFALHGDREFFLKARPTDIYYMEEEVTQLSICDAKFPDVFGKEAVLEEIDKLTYRYDNPYVTPYDDDSSNILCSYDTEHKCRIMVLYLTAFLSIK